MEYKLAKKAYGVNWGRIDEGGYYAGDIDPVYAESRGKAKSALLPALEEYDLFDSDEPITYLNAPVIRLEHEDKFFFDGKELTLMDIEREIMRQERRGKLDEIAADETISYCYIKKRGLYYRSNSSGYTEYIIKAGIYEKANAISKALSCEDLKVVPIDIAKHNQIMQTTIDDLQKRIIAIS